MFANKIRSGMGKPIFFIFILTLITSCANSNLQSHLQLETPSKTSNKDSILKQIDNFRLQVAQEIQNDDYPQAFFLQNRIIQIQDSLYHFEVGHNYINTEIATHILKIKQNKLKIHLLIAIIICCIFIIILLLYKQHRKLKIKCDKLSEMIKHTEWSFLITKEFITENHIAYDELERLLNREKSLNNLTSESYKRLYEALIQQKANSSGRLMYRLTNFDGNFGMRFQCMFPECNTDELLLASMIHHQWKMSDMTAIFHVSPDALRKRKNRLAQKISTKLQKDIDLDVFLKHL